MHNQRSKLKKNLWYSVFFLLVLTFALAGCGGIPEDGSGDPQYEAKTIIVEGLSVADQADISIEEISISELRKLPQYKLSASYKAPIFGKSSVI